MADRTRNTVIIGFSQRLVTITDVAFTAAGAALLAWSGPMMATQTGGYGPAWVVWGVGLFIASGVLWVAVLIPVEILQARLAHGFAHGGDVPQRYWQLANIWMATGAVATILPLGALVLMVTKPV